MISNFYKIMNESCFGNFLLLFWFFGSFFFLFLNNNFFRFFLLFQRFLKLNFRVEINIFVSQLIKNTVHNFFILFDIIIVISLFKSLFNLFSQFLSKSVSWIDKEMIKSCGHSTLVGKIS